MHGMCRCVQACGTLNLCFLSENMVGSGCQVQPEALPAAAMVRTRGLSLTGLLEQTEPVLRTSREGGAAAFGRSL